MNAIIMCALMRRTELDINAWFGRNRDAYRNAFIYAAHYQFFFSVADLVFANALECRLVPYLAIESYVS